MRKFIVVMLLGSASIASAQEPPPNATDPYGAPPPVYAPPPPAYPPAYPPPAYGAPPPYVAAPMPPPSMPGQPMTLYSPRTASYSAQWKGARVMNGFAGAIGLVTTGLSLSGSIYVLAAGYPPSASSVTAPPSPSDPAQALSYVSSASSAFAFGLAAGSLGWRHHILRDLGADTGRGLFISGTVVGLVGVAAMVSSFIVGFSNVGNAHDQGIAVLATSLGGSAICNVGTAMLAKDGTNVQKVWKSLSTF